MKRKIDMKPLALNLAHINGYLLNTIISISVLYVILIFLLLLLVLVVMSLSFPGYKSSISQGEVNHLIN